MSCQATKSISPDPLQKSGGSVPNVTTRPASQSTKTNPIPVVPRITTPEKSGGPAVATLLKRATKSTRARRFMASPSLELSDFLSGDHRCPSWSSCGGQPAVRRAWLHFSYAARTAAIRESGTCSAVTFSFSRPLRCRPEVMKSAAPSLEPAAGRRSLHDRPRQQRGTARTSRVLRPMRLQGSATARGACQPRDALTALPITVRCQQCGQVSRIQVRPPIPAWTNAAR